MLDRDTRRQLLDALGSLTLFNTPEGRDLLLRGVPVQLTNAISRSTVKIIDLDRIIEACEQWAPASSNDPSPLRILIENAYQVTEGSRVAAKLQTMLEALAQLQSDDPTVDTVPECPYPGIVAFRFEDARFFYGRETEIERMLLRMRQQPFLVVLGPSGSGKSSLVFAGLLPTLVRRYSGTYHVITLRPGQYPTAALAQALGADPANPQEAVTTLLAAHQPARRLLLIVDQLEEIFTQAEEEEERQFIAALKMLWVLDECQAILTLRADFYPDLMNSDLWPVGEGERQEVGPLRGEKLRSAIQKPAEKVGVQIQEGLLERLVADAADEPGSLPLMQETLRLLWDKMNEAGGRTLTLPLYWSLGRTYMEQLTPEGESEEPLSGLAVALALRADATMRKLTDPQQAVARRVFVRLVQFCEGRPDTRRQRPRSDLQALGDDLTVLDDTLRVLTESRLLTLTGREGDSEREVNIAHDALIHNWPTLHKWVEERREAEQTRRHLLEKAREWMSKGQGKTRLLDEDELAEAERWLASPDSDELGVDPVLPPFIETSRNVIWAARNYQLRLLRQRLAVSVGLGGIISAVALALLLIFVVFPQVRQWRAQGELVTIPAGQAVIGIPATAVCDACDPEKPQWVVTFTTAFALERYEVTNQQYRLCMDDHGCTAPQDLQALQQFADQHFADHPVAGVNAQQAFAYCRWLGRRLPTELEWERAARGSNGRQWPWGDTPAPDTSHANLPFLPGAKDVSQPVTYYSAGSSPAPEAVFNLVGNVWEWTASYESESYQDYDPGRVWRDGQLASLPDGAAVLIVRGGSWLEGIQRVTQRTPINWYIATPSVGFRCAAGETAATR